MAFESIQYLQSGNPTQQLAYQAITEAGIMEYLKEFDPILAGTIPIAIDIPSSDLDILCWHPDLAVIEQTLEARFVSLPNWQIQRSDSRQGPCVVANFSIPAFEVEIFAATIPTLEQYGYLHMMVEYHILQERGDEFSRKVVELKSNGMKTEPAFAHLLELQGDQYEALLEYGRKRKWIIPKTK